MVGGSCPSVDQRGDPDHQDRLGGGRNRIQFAGSAPTLFVYYSLFFFFGWLLSGQTDLLEDLKRGAWLRLGAGALIAVPAFLLFYDSGDFTGNVGTPGILAEIDELRLYGLFTVGMVCWLTLFGIWGVLARYVRKESRVLRYLSDASFWIYLVHIPFLVALQSSLSTTELAIPVRWGLAVSGTLALAIGTYALIRGVRKLATKHVRPRGAPG